MAPVLLPMPCKKFHAPHVVVPGNLQAPCAIAGKAWHECGADEMQARRRAHAVETGNEIVTFGREPSEKTTCAIWSRPRLSCIDRRRQAAKSTPARRAAASRMSCRSRRDRAHTAGMRASPMQERVIDDQTPLRIEDLHAVVHEALRQNVVENAERLVDAQRVRGLSKADARHVERRPPLDESHGDAALREAASPMSARRRHRRATRTRRISVTRLALFPHSRSCRHITMRRPRHRHAGSGSPGCQPGSRPSTPSTSHFIPPISASVRDFPAVPCMAPA